MSGGVHTQRALPDLMRCRRVLHEDHWAELKRTLMEHGWLTQEIRDVMTQGTRFWELEHKLCHAMRHGASVALEEVDGAYPVHIRTDCRGLGAAGLCREVL